MLLLHNESDLRPAIPRTIYETGSRLSACSEHMRASKQRPPLPAQRDFPLVEWLTAEEAAHHLRVKSRTLLLWVRQDKVKGYKLSGTKRHVWRFNVDRGKLDRPAA
jgi:excisionase family DNA binding protein